MSALRRGSRLSRATADTGATASPRSARPSRSPARSSCSRRETGTARHRSSTVPKVVGMPVGAAKSALLEGGFDVRVGAQRHADRPAGTVAAVRPASASAQRGALITLIPSSGPARVARPRGHRILAGGREGRARAPRLHRADEHGIRVRPRGHRGRHGARGRSGLPPRTARSPSPISAGPRARRRGEAGALPAPRRTSTRTSRERATRSPKKRH